MLLSQGAMIQPLSPAEIENAQSLLQQQQQAISLPDTLLQQQALAWSQTTAACQVDASTDVADSSQPLDLKMTTTAKASIGKNRTVAPNTGRVIAKASSKRALAQKSLEEKNLKNAPAASSAAAVPLPSPTLADVTVGQLSECINELSLNNMPADALHSIYEAARDAAQLGEAVHRTTRETQTTPPLSADGRPLPNLSSSQLQILKSQLAAAAAATIAGQPMVNAHGHDTSSSLAIGPPRFPVPLNLSIEDKASIFQQQTGTYDATGEFAANEDSIPG